MALGLFGGVALDLGGRRESNAKAVLVRRAAYPSHADRRLIGAVADIVSGAVRMRLNGMGKPVTVGKHVDAENDFRIKGKRRIEPVMRQRVFGKLRDEGHIVRLRRDMRRDRTTHPHRSGVIGRRIVKLAMIDRPEIGMGEIHHLHRRALQVFHLERHVKQRRAGLHDDLRRGEIIRAEGDGMAVAAANRYPLQCLVDFEPCLLEWRVGNLPVKRMAVFRTRRAKAGQPAMDHEGAIGFEIDLRVDRFVEHRLHRQVAAVEPRAPDLLSLERQNNDLAAGVAHTQSLDTGCISEGRNGKFADFDKLAFGILETGTIELDTDRHSPLHASQRIRSPLVSSKI